MTARRSAGRVLVVNHPEPDPGAAAATDPSRSDERPGSVVHPASIQDAADVVERIDADEAAAREARDRYLVEPITPTADQPDRSVVGDVLAADEVVYAQRGSAILNAGRSEVPGYGGRLYLTRTRLVLVGQVTVAIQLADVVETSIGGDRLLLTLRNGDGVELDVGQPRLLRTEIAAVRSLGRS